MEMNVNEAGNRVSAFSVDHFSGIGSSFTEYAVFDYHISGMKLKIFSVYFYIFDNHSDTPF